jgi:glycosyltransferase involved in cell wall biosynthesis
MQVPIVATNVSGVPDLVEDGINGFLVPARDPHALADRVAVLLRDASLRRTFARAGRQRVLRDFDVQSNTRRILDLFHEAMGLQPVVAATSQTVAAQRSSQR